MVFKRKANSAFGKIGSGALCFLLIALLLAACGGKDEKQNNTGNDTEGESKSLQKITVVLDWTPNTNHTGLYVAKANGYFEEQGLDVTIVQPGDAGAESMVATGKAEFGVSYQEQMTQARVAGIPLVSIAAVIQHNTSGFGSPADKNITAPEHFEGKVYGGWGNPVEEAVIQSVMEQAGADASKVSYLNIGDVDFFTATQRDIDFAWIFYAWTGIEAELRNEPINMIYVKDLSEKLDYYTPVLVTSETIVNEQPELAEAFMTATSQGYRFAIENPDEAAGILLAAEPDLDEELVKASQRWLADQYQADAPRWGEQKREVWSNYAEWMSDHDLLEGDFDPDEAFTNDFLP